MTTKYVEIATASGVEKPRRRNKLILLQRAFWKNSDDERCGYHYHDGRPASAAYAVLNDVKTPLGGARLMLHGCHCIYIIVYYVNEIYGNYYCEWI